MHRTIRAMRIHSWRRDAPAVEGPAGSPVYEIRVRGVIGETLLVAFPGLRARTHQGETVLSGALPDQAALHGVLGQIEALGLELIEVRRI